MSYKELINGFNHFQEEYKNTAKGKMYKELAENGQKPETLVIACSDSRIDPAILTHSAPGEFFAIRNVAALVPPYKSASVLRGTSSAIEYAVRHLGVKHIVILGHAGCGGIQALATGNYRVGNNHNFQFLDRWLGIGQEAKDEVYKKFECSDDDEKIKVLEQASIIVSMNNLLSFPWIKDKCERKEILIHGWYFDMLNAELFEYCLAEEQFKPIEQTDTNHSYLTNLQSLEKFLESYTRTCPCHAGN